MEIRKDNSVNNSVRKTGLWECPECENRFHGGGKALHQPGCSRTGYAGLTFLVSTATLRSCIPRYFDDDDVARALEG